MSDARFARGSADVDVDPTAGRGVGQEEEQVVLVEHPPPTDLAEDEIVPKEMLEVDRVPGQGQLGAGILEVAVAEVHGVGDRVGGVREWLLAFDAPGPAATAIA